MCSQNWTCLYVGKVKVSVTQSCPALCDSMDHSPPDSSVHGILQARILEWVAISFSKWTQGFCIAGKFFTIWTTREALHVGDLLYLETGAYRRWKRKSLSRVGLFATPWTVGHQVPLSMRFSRQQYWSGLPCPPQGELPNSRIKQRSPALQVDSLLSKPPGKPPMYSLIPANP